MSSAASTRRIERLYPDDAEIDPEIAELVGQEILRDRLEPAAWARALAASHRAGNTQSCRTPGGKGAHLTEPGRGLHVLCANGTSLRFSGPV